MECLRKKSQLRLALSLALALSVIPAVSWARLPIGEDPPGTCKDQAPVPQWRPPAFVDTLADDLKRELDPTYLRWIDANFLFEARKQNDSLKLQSIPSGNEGLQNGLLTERTWNLFSAGLSREGPSLSEYLQELRTQGRAMPSEQRLLLLSLWGDTLGRGYDYRLPDGGMRLEDVFRNAQGRGKQGGVCRHIHDLVQEMAKALGFEAAGAHSGNWKQADGTQAHAVAHYRDPTTGEYYMQNYSSIVNTKEKTLQGAVDVSTKILGPLSSTSAVESNPGRVHLYQPRTARWVKEQLERRAFAENAPIISLDIGNRTQTIGAQADVGKFKVFGFHTNYAGGSGDTQLSAVGGSWKDGVSKKINDSALSEMGAAVQAYGGYQRLKSSKLEPDSQDHEHDWSRKNMFYGARADGYARFFDDQVTGYTRVEVSSSDFDPMGLGKKFQGGSNPYNEMAAGVQVGKPDSPVSLSLERTWEVTKNTINEGSAKINTNEDTLSLRAVWDNASKTASVESESNLYIFGGIERMDAVAFSQKLKASVNLDESSQLYVQGWSYNPMSNASNDPFYDTGRALGIEAGYMKEFESGLRFFVSAGATRGSSYGMVDAEQTDLEMGANDGTEYYATVGMGMSIGPRKPRNPRR